MHCVTVSFVIMCSDSPEGLSDAAIDVSLEGYTSSPRLGQQMVDIMPWKVAI